MAVPVGSGEPVVTEWVAASAEALMIRLALPTVDRTRIVAVDGRSGAGKSTLTATLHAAVPGSAVVGTDDVAWNLSMFGWADELAVHVLEPVRRGEPVDYRPPGWVTHDRPGSIVVPAAVSVLFVEGVGSSRRELAGLTDAAVWVQSDEAVAKERGIERDVASGVNGDRSASITFWDTWTAEENPFLAADAPWARAAVIAAGVPLARPGTVFLGC